MTYLLNIVDEHPEPWTNFLKEYGDGTRYRPFQELKQFNAENVYGKPYIAFETEADATAFILRFS